MQARPSAATPAKPVAATALHLIGTFGPAVSGVSRKRSTRCRRHLDYFGLYGRTHQKPDLSAVSAGNTGHNEVVQVAYDPAKVSYAQLLDTFWRNIDPTQANGQFCDHGSQYRSEIFITMKTTQSRRSVEGKTDKDKPFSGDIKTLLTRSTEFYAAEEYHQDYYKKNPVRYTYYKTSCGRAARLKEVWKTQ